MAAKGPARASLRYAKAPLSPRYQWELHQLLGHCSTVRDLAAGYFTVGRFVVWPDVEPKHARPARDLVGEDPTRQLAAEEKLQAAGATLDEIYTGAYQTLAENLSHHEKRIESLEKRRRELMDDYDALRVIAPRMRSNG
ncbi:hypothetical protein [Sulfitobacter sp.]|uniref:hypothetical protein n=1 Tax=Sulfitobacter sp. TaxID=1903071 RepID=UPI0032992894